MNERLIVAADFKPDAFGVNGICQRVLTLADSLKDTGVVIKVNSALRACGVELIKHLHGRGVRVMADYKLVDIPETMETDAEILFEYKPELLTVMCSAGVEGMRRVQMRSSHLTEVLGVTVLTSLDEEECQAIFTCSTKAGVLRLARLAQLAGLGGLILSSQEAEMLLKKQELVLSLNTPGIRPGWALVKGDDQSRVMTPAKAIAAGADRIVIGRPILQAAPNDKGLPQNPREAVAWTLTEIADGLTARRQKK